MKLLYTAALFALIGVTSCDTDHEPDWNEPVTQAVNMTSASVAEGSTVSTTLDKVNITYSMPVALNALVSPTLNDVAVTASVSSENASVVIINLPTLQPSTEYTLVVPSRSVAGVNSHSFASAVTLKFTTEAVQTPEMPTITPEGLINANATVQTVNVYNFLADNFGKKIISGAMANVNNNNDFAAWIKDKTGKDVVINGYDFIHMPESGQNWIDYTDITPARTHWDANGLVSYMWHWRVPTDEQAWKDKDFNRYGSRTPGEGVEDPTDFNIENALTEGTWEHDFIIEDIDKVASVLKQLQDEGIPVIWRPLHEAAGSYKYNGAWFWWGAKGGEATKKLWQLMYDRLVNFNGLNNLIWVWTAQYEEGFTDRMKADYPGNEWVDVIGTDIYADNDASQVAAYGALAELGSGKKLVTISETGLIQNPDKCFADKAYWSWFSLWYTYDIHKTGADTDGFGNTAQSLRQVLESPYVITLDQMPSLK